MPDSLLELEKRRSEVLAQISALGDFRRGSISATGGRCGTLNCHCHKPDDPGHGPNLRLTYKLEGKTVFFSTHILSDAEAICDRVAIIHKGELRGVGAVEDLTSSVQGKVEVIWQGTIVPASIKALGAECHVAGDRVRAVIAETQQDAVIDALRRERLRLIAITPVRTSLEAYFVEKLRRAETTAGSTV